MKLAKFYPNMKVKKSMLLNTDISLINVILSVHILKMLSDVVIKAILHVITSYALMTMFQYLVLSLIVVWHIDLLPKLELNCLHISLLQCVSVISNQSKELNIIQVLSPNTKYLTSEFCPQDQVSKTRPNSKTLTQCDEISNVSTCVSSHSDSITELSDTNTKASSASISTEEKLKQSVASAMDVVSETPVSDSKNDLHESIQVCTERIEEVDTGLGQLNKTLLSIEKDLKCLSTDILHLDKVQGDLRSSSQLLSDKDTIDAAKLVGHKEEVHPHLNSSKLQDLKSLSSVIGKFDGENSRYPSFKYRFCIIADTTSLTDADKGLLLYMSLENSVTDLLGRVTDEGHISYKKLWTELDSEFDPVQHGLLSHISALFEIEDMAICDTLGHLVKLYRFVKRQYIALDRISAKHEVEGFKMKILSKLRGEVADKVASYMNKYNDKSTVSDILDILREEILTMEVQQIAEDLHNHTPNREDSKPFTSTVSPEDTDSHCMFCMVDGHNSSACRRFPSPKEYHRFLCHHNLCFNCLQYGHLGYNCPQPRQCNLCSDRRKHSQVLCLCYHSQDRRGCRY